ncbi:MAG: TatD family hydrolase [Chloroflexia bacterium]|nr:TatD family hydrolase [Chloroflexia bacterium]
MAHLHRSTLFDTHTHLAVDRFDEDRPEVLERARQRGVREMLVVGYDLASSAAALSLVQREMGLYAAVGIQPHYAQQVQPQDLEQLLQLAQQPGVVALGEIGLDYYRDRAPRSSQRQLFREQLALAKELGLPVVIHSREASRDLLEDLLEAGQGVRGVMHCFSGSLEQAQDFMALGFYISLAGPVTYPRAEDAWQVAREVPLERLLIETDCPWLPPQAHRGQRNEPAYLVETAARIAELRGIDLEQLAEATTGNARSLFLQGGS